MEQNSTPKIIELFSEFESETALLLASMIVNRDNIIKEMLETIDWLNCQLEKSKSKIINKKDEMIELVKFGNVLKAVKLYRTLYRSSLKDAANYIMGLRFEIVRGLYGDFDKVYHSHFMQQYDILEGKKLNKEHIDKCISLIKNCNFVSAIHYYRQVTGACSKEAIFVIEYLKNSCINGKRVI